MMNSLHVENIVHPQRGIYSESDLNNFKNSEVYREINNFIRLCGDAVIGKKISDGQITSEVIEKLEIYIGDCREKIDNFPPLAQPMRFGNKAFRLWLADVVNGSSDFIRSLVPSEQHFAVEELSSYLNDSFGNERRIDYGTGAWSRNGHETNFALFLLCLVKLRVIHESELSALILRVFSAYIKTMRKLQQTYLLEPAGSHGVWGLDDYHCLIYVWGSSQLIDHPEITPRDVRDINLVHANEEEYMYMEGIRTINVVKSTAPFSETSPMLYSVSDLGDWRAVRNGMYKLYMGEVLNKLPVVQHLLFGNLLRCTWSPSPPVVPPTRPSHLPPSSIVPRLPQSYAGGGQRSANGHHVVEEVATKAPWA